MAKARAHKTAAEVLTKDLMTYSVRFTDAERELLARAAALKGWSPTNLIRQAALESSVAIVNTASQPAFKGLALKLAEQLAKPRFYVVSSVDPNSPEQIYTSRFSEQDLARTWEPPREHEDQMFIIRVEPETPQPTAEVVAQIAKAAKHGGAEFVRPFVDYTEGFSASEKLDMTKLVTSVGSD